MAEQLPDVPRDGVRVIVSQRVVDKIMRGALLYPEPETGEALVGLVVPQAGRVEPDIYVLDTISPGEHKAVREWGMFEQGDDWQGDVFVWLDANWEAFRELRRSSYGSALAAKWDVPLMHVGDWHKQPGDMTAPSPGDDMTAREMIADTETPVHYIVAPIVTMYPLETVSEAEAEAEAAPTDSAPDAAPVSATDGESSMPEQESNTIISVLEAEGWRVRVDFWYMSKHRKRFVPVTPVVWPSDRLPILPPLAWHLAHPRRFDQEYTLMVEAGYSVDYGLWDADGKPPYELLFSVYKPGNRHVVLLVTPADYPARMPAVRIAPLVGVEEGRSLFELLYEKSQPALLTQMPEWPWDSKRTLVELVWHFDSLAKQDNQA